ncbi:MAG: hypothetical protein AB7N53_19845 [Candidatus Binatia bacterium]
MFYLLIKSLLIATAFSLPATAIAAQCCGDCDGDGRVTIADLLTAINLALNGGDAGPTPSPTVPSAQCPIDFGDDNTQPGTPDCYYRGRWSRTCGANDLEALWRSDHSDPELVLLIVSFLGFSPGLFIGAEVSSSHTAELLGWFTEPGANDLTEVSGDMTLTADGGTLTIITDQTPFNVDACAFRRYEGALFDVVTPDAARATAAAALRNPAALARLRDAARARQARPDFERRPQAGK